MPQQQQQYHQAGASTGLISEVKRKISGSGSLSSMQQFQQQQLLQQQMLQRQIRDVSSASPSGSPMAAAMSVNTGVGAAGAAGAVGAIGVAGVAPGAGAASLTAAGGSPLAASPVAPSRAKVVTKASTLEER